jgi:hypothetical protein
MTFGHRRHHERTALLAAGVLSGREREEALGHLDACTACRDDLAELRSTLELVALDPVRDALPPIPVGALGARVRARLDEGPTPSPWRWALLPAAALAAAVLVTVLVPRSPIEREAAPLPAIATSDDTLDRLERNVAREQTARYLSEAQDVLVTVAATPADCDRAKDRVDVGQASARSRDLLARRALMVEAGGTEVASARPVLDDVEQALREVASLESCVRAKDMARLRDQVERQRLLMRIRLMTRELEG